MSDALVRALTGQLFNPPNTAISVPEQQAISNLQGGFGGLADALGAGATQRETPGPGQAGLQTREQLGLPDRRTYFPGMPTYDEAQAKGVIPTIRPSKGAKGQARRAKKGKEIA